MKKIVITSIAALTVASTLMAGVPGSCVGCHGKDGSHNSMVKQSKPNTMAKADIVTALEGYKAGTRNTYGKGAMMKNFAKNLSDAQIKDIANTWGK